MLWCQLILIGGSGWWEGRGGHRLCCPSSCLLPVLPVLAALLLAPHLAPQGLLGAVAGLIASLLAWGSLNWQAAAQSAHLRGRRPAAGWVAEGPGCRDAAPEQLYGQGLQCGVDYHNAVRWSVRGGLSLRRHRMEWQCTTTRTCFIHAPGLEDRPTARRPAAASRASARRQLVVQVDRTAMPPLGAPVIVVTAHCRRRSCGCRAPVRPASPDAWCGVCCAASARQRAPAPSFLPVAAAIVLVLRRLNIDRATATSAGPWSLQRAAAH